MAREFRIQITGRFGLYESLLYRIEPAGSEMAREFRIQNTGRFGLYESLPL